MDYRTAGVDVEQGDRLVARLKAMMGAAGARIGHFGGMIPIPVERYRKPLLVNSIDSVGTKVMVAVALGKYDGIGRDMLHHAINDIACCGAEPLAFMDYVAMPKLDETLFTGLLGSIVAACEEWKVPLVGGETCEMPGVYQAGEFDLVGAISGVVEADEVIDGRDIHEGDVIIGFASDGLHTNGFSLSRRVFEDAGLDYRAQVSELGCTLGEALLTVHYCYIREIRLLKSEFQVKGLAHITGGGLEGNSSRIMPQGLHPWFDWSCWPEPPIFGLIRRLGNVPEADMRRTFNLGIGLTAVLGPDAASYMLSGFPKELKRPIRIGIVKAGAV